MPSAKRIGGFGPRQHREFVHNLHRLLWVSVRAEHILSNTEGCSREQGRVVCGVRQDPAGLRDANGAEASGLHDRGLSG